MPSARSPSAGDEVLILAPHWPLIDGICRSFGAVPVDVPFFGVADSPEAAVRIVEEKRTPRTVALYVNTPNNPSGRVLPRAWLEALVEWARREELWLLFDEVYEDYQYEGTHAYGFSLAPERSFSAHSFSKGFGMAGYRCGWLAGPPGPMDAALKLHTHSVYSATTASQVAALRVLTGAGDAWLAETRAAYAETGRKAAARLGVPPPEGIDVSLPRRLGRRSAPGGLPGVSRGVRRRGALRGAGAELRPLPDARPRLLHGGAAGRRPPRDRGPREAPRPLTRWSICIMAPGGGRGEIRTGVCDG